MQCADRLLDIYQRTSSGEWPWFEERVTYSNARLSQALIASGALTRDDLHRLQSTLKDLHDCRRMLDAALKPDLTFTDPRIKAAIIFSPSSPTVGTAKEAFADVKIPWMLMTGTKDVVPMITNTDMKSRLGVYPALPPGGKYELVLDGAEHSVFTDRPLPGEGGVRNPKHHPTILAISTVGDALRDALDPRLTGA